MRDLLTPITDDVRLAVRERPPGPPVMYQTWKELLFLHWSADPEIIQRSLPKGLTVDTFDDRAWVGVVPFFMRNVRPRGMPALRRISNFLELNLRTYAVDGDGVPGVWFYSLDANQWLAVRVARRVFGLPYQHAAMTASENDGHIRYESRRRGQSEPLRFEWRPRGDACSASPGSLEFFLIERYAMFVSAGVGRLRTGLVHHAPYEYFDVELPVWDAGLFALNGLPVPSGPPEHACVCRGVETEIFPLSPPR